MTVDELGTVGMERLDDAEIRSLLERQGVGVLGLAVDSEPYLVPLSFGFDGESALYFAYLHGEESRKQMLSERAGRAQFLVYEAASPGDWRSVQVSGSVEAVPADEWDDPETEDALENAWHPHLFEDGRYATDVTLYRLRIEDVSGIKHEGGDESVTAGEN